MPRLQALGHEVTVFELSNGTRLPQQIGGVQVVPTGIDSLGSDMVRGYFDRLRAHATITLIDAWGLNADVMQGVNWYPLAPIDTTPTSPANVNALKHAEHPIAIAQFGVNELRKSGFDPLYWPHAVDPNVWTPGDKQAARRQLGVREDAFLAAFVGVNDSNPSRKGIPELLAAWQMFSEQHPGALLYMHTSTTGNIPVTGVHGGVNIPLLIKTFGLNPQSVMLVNQHDYYAGIPTSNLVQLAQAADVLVLPTRGEGFGLPLLEFARVGCPTITTDFGAGAELCFGGWLIEGEPEWTWRDALMVKPGIASLTEALQAAYEERDNPQRRMRQIHGAMQYDVDCVMSIYAAPVLQRIAEETLDRVAL